MTINKIIENNSLLQEMIEDMNQADEKYRPGNYWQFYINKIVKQIKKSDLNEFRNLDGGAGSGSLTSLEGGKEFYSNKFGWSFHPLDDDFKKFDNNFFLRKFNRLISKLSVYFPFFKFFSVRSAIARIYYEDAVKRIQDLTFDKVALLDKNKLLEKIQDSKVGNPQGFIKNGRFYTMKILDEISQIINIEDHTKLHDINSVVEIGSGIGIKAATFLQVNPKLKYFLIDIAPGLYIAQKYLIANNYKVLTYEELKKMKNKNLSNDDLKNYNAVCLAPWMLDSIKNLKFDMFVNVKSFQEMEPWIVQNYLNILSPKIRKIIYLANSKEGSALGLKNKFGVLKQTKRNDYINFLSSNFDLVKEKDSLHNDNQLIFEKKS